MEMESTTVKSLRVCRGVSDALDRFSRSLNDRRPIAALDAGRAADTRPPPYLPDARPQHWNHSEGRLQLCDWVFVVMAACQQSFDLWVTIDVDIRRDELKGRTKGDASHF
jgi:hypothetical protein